MRIEVRSEEGTLIPSTTKVDESTSTIHVSYTVHKPGRYSVIIYQKDQIVEEHFFLANPSNNCVSLHLLNDKVLIDQTSKFELEVAEGLEAQLHIEVTDPDGNSIPVSLHKQEGRTFNAVWLPKREGSHVITVFVKQQPVAGTPIKVNVLDLSAVQLHGLTNDVVGKQQKFEGMHYYYCSSQWLQK